MHLQACKLGNDPQESKNARDIHSVNTEGQKLLQSLNINVDL